MMMYYTFACQMDDDADGRVNPAMGLDSMYFM